MHTVCMHQAAVVGHQADYVRAECLLAESETYVHDDGCMPIVTQHEPG